MSDKNIHGYSVNVFKLDSFDQIPDKPGIYSWHLLSKNESLDSYLKIFKQKFYESTIKGHFSEKYKGNITSDFENINFEPVSDNLIKAVTHFFCPPVYIGISKSSLRVRLNTHKKMLINEINNDEFQNTELQIDEDDLDTDNESKYFAKRLSNVLRTMRKEISEKNLFIKILYNLDSDEIIELNRAEYIINRVYNPIYGRR